MAPSTYAVGRVRPTSTSLGLMWLVSACTGHVPEAPQPEPTRDASVPTTPAPRSPDPDPLAVATPTAERQCGEFGSTPTPLPSGLAGATDEIGRATITVGGKARIGNVDLTYVDDMMFGTRRAFDREPGLSAVVDPSVEPIEGAYGGQAKVRAGEPFTFEVGAYRIEGRASASAEKAPPLEVVVRRRGCPRHGVATWSGDAASMWLGSTAMRAQTTTDGTRQVQVVVNEAGLGKGFVLRWSESGAGPSWGDAVDLTPAAVGRRFEGVSHEGRIAAIEPSAGASFVDGRWQAAGDGVVELAVRVDLRRRTRRVPTPAGPVRVAGCGEPRVGPPALPTDALRAPVPGKRVKVGRGAPVTLDGRTLRLEYEPPEPRPGARPDFPERWTLAVIDASGAALSNTMLGGHHEVQRVRLGQEFLWVEPGPAVDPVTVRHFTLACPAEHREALRVEAHEIVLSTAGLGFVELGVGTEPALYLQLSTHATGVHLSASRGSASYSWGELVPDAAGDAFGLGDRDVEILEVGGFGATTWDGKAWQTTDADGVRVFARIGIGVGAGTSGK